MRGIKCGKSQLSRDEATVGLINWGGMSAHGGEERSFIWYMSKFGAPVTKHCGARGRTEVFGTAQTGRKPRKLVRYL